ncbi:MAG: PAS domain S-box protein [Candidatus Binatia bacterium]
MKQTTLLRQLDAAQRRVAALRRSAGGPGGAPALLRDVLVEVSKVLEDFQQLADASPLWSDHSAAADDPEIERRCEQETLEALRCSEARTQAIVNAAVDGIITIDEQGIVQSLNPAAERLFGYSAQEVIGQDIKILVPPPWRDEHDDFLAKYLSTGERKTAGMRRAVVGARKDSSTFPADLTVSEMLVDDHRLFIGIVRDVTEHRQAERRLAAQYAVTRVLAESTTLREAIPKMLGCICEGVGWELGELWRLDAEANVLRWDGMWHRRSAEASEFEAVSHRMTFAPGEGLSGRAWESNQPAWISNVLEDSGFLRPSLATNMGLYCASAFPIRTGNVVSGVMVFFSREVRPPDHDLLQMLDALGNQIGDFIARKRAEEALRESDRRFALFMQNLPGVAFMKDVQGRYVYVNEHFANTFHAQGWLGKVDDECWSPGVASQFKQNDRVVLDSGKALQAIETVPHDDGLHSWLVSKFPILNESGEPVMVGGVAVDITEREQAEAKLRELQRLARQRERLADIGAITAEIVHDMGNPLAGVSMQAQLILRRVQRDETQPVSTIMRPMQRIVSEVHRLDALIKEFMDFSREQRLHLTTVHVPRFLASVAELWEPLASTRGIRLLLEVPEELPPITADEEKLHRVFENLVKNAVEAIDRGPGQIRIYAATPRSEKIRISIEDSGPGIPQDLEVFRLFETTKPYGSGLGLPIVRQIVLAHGGGIAFARLEPHGTVFDIELPCRGPLPQGREGPAAR